MYKINSASPDESLLKAEPENEIFSSSRFIGFTFGAGSESMNSIIQGKPGLFIEVNDTIHLQVINDIKKDTLQYILTPEQVREYTRNKLNISAEQKNELIQSAGGEINIADNNLDFGFVPEKESKSGRTEYRVSFKYKRGYDFIGNAPLFFQASGMFSTNFRDSLNYLSVSPVSYYLMKDKNEIVCQAGFESDQVFSYCRFTGNLHWEGILPNLVDLTYGADRLRLKPILEAGFKVYQEIRNDRKQEDRNSSFPGIVYAQLFYNIPVSKIYSLDVEGKGFYDFNIMNNPNKKVKFLYSLTFGMEISKTGIHTIFKYSNGETDIRYARTRTMLIGLTADLVGGLIKK
jgi:hypothetical protein